MKPKITVQRAKKMFADCEEFEETGKISEQSELRVLARELFTTVDTIYISHLLLTTKEVYRVLAKEYMK